MMKQQIEVLGKADHQGMKAGNCKRNGKRPQQLHTAGYLVRSRLRSAAMAMAEDEGPN